MLQNLQAMRLCAELGIDNSANLIVDFPGSTDAEVAETRETILRYALAYQPLNPCRLVLGVDNALDARRDEFGVTNVRNSDSYRAGLPDDVWRRLSLFDLSFDVARPSADWSPVRAACAQWSQLQADRKGQRLLHYRDGGTFLMLRDERHGELRTLTVDGPERDLYLYCSSIRTREQIARELAGRMRGGDVDDVLAQLVDLALMAREGERYLALAVAATPQHAARRIKAGIAAELRADRAVPPPGATPRRSLVRVTLTPPSPI